jgi:hypothetical protein
MFKTKTTTIIKSNVNKSESKKPEVKISKSKNILKKSVQDVLQQSEKKVLNRLNLKRKQGNKSRIDEVSYDSYLNFKHSLTMLIGKTIHLDYDVFEAIVKKYKIKTV